MHDKPDGAAPLDETLATSSTRRKAGRGVIVALQIFTFVALMGTWQVLSATKILDPFFFSRPSDIALRLWEWLSTGFIWPHLATTLTEALLAFFVVFFNTYQGVREVDLVILNNARMLQASDRQLLRHVYLPSAMAWIFSSLHTSIGFALVGAVVGEYLGSARGVGYVVAQAQGVFDTTGVFA